MSKSYLDTCFHKLEYLEQEIKIPTLFTFPFFYQPDELAIQASNQLIQRIESIDWLHEFWPTTSSEGLGKMFGVLVVKKNDELGYLSAFSGKIGEEVSIDGFVPPVFNRLSHDSYFKKGEREIEDLTEQIEALKTDPNYKNWLTILDSQKRYSYKVIEKIKNEIKIAKTKRQNLRDSDEYINQDFLNEESKLEQIKFKRIKRFWKERIEFLTQKVAVFENNIELLKTERKNLSTQIQTNLFEDYKFLNYNKEERNLLSIFKHTSSPIPPAGAGDCSAPRLLQYAYKNDYQPISMAEFWWGKSPNSVIRKHKEFYPSCRSKCEPILGHMLKGLNVAKNPMLETPKTLGEIETIFEDDFLIVINKPSELLSAPGKTITDCVLFRLEQLLATKQQKPYLIHRLDMSTSGIMIVAKTKEAHKSIQRQFLNKKIQKEYIAILEGKLTKKTGKVVLPLRVDVDNRPHQMVCYEHGKYAETEYEVLSYENGKTRILFRPITGRTHQLRMHAAHPNGLNIAILGDDLYGSPANRLHLHAAKITFSHPISKEVLTFEVPPKF